MRKGKRCDTRYIVFQRKTRKTGKKLEKRGKTLKNREKKQEKNRKLQEIQKQDFDEVLGNAENGNKFGNEFWNEFGNEFGNKLEVFSNVTKRRFEGKNDTLSHPYAGLRYAHCTPHVNKS